MSKEGTMKRTKYTVDGGGKWITPPDPRHTCEECGKPEDDDEGSWAPDPVRFFCGKDCHEKWMDEHPEEDAAEKEFFGIVK
jgi:hypothetical protein